MIFLLLELLEPELLPAGPPLLSSVAALLLSGPLPTEITSLPSLLVLLPAEAEDPVSVFFDEAVSTSVGSSKSISVPRSRSDPSSSVPVLISLAPLVYTSVLPATSLICTTPESTQAPSPAT